MSQTTLHKYKLFVDGASRNNPGPSGAGIYLEQNNKIIYSNGFYLGDKTNNQAEYLALIIGLLISKKYLNQNDFLEVISDSELLVKQIIGLYKIKNLELKKLNNISMTILKSINYVILHVRRENNTKADQNANLAIDKKINLPIDLVDFFKNNEIYI